MALPRDRSLLVKAARMYYELGQSQDQIALEMGVSRSNVSRMLTDAKTQGIVQIRIVEQAMRDVAVRLAVAFDDGDPTRILITINWGVGENFHMTQHTAARCSDDPNIDQRPPAAPVDTIEGVGIGRYNNQDGYTVRFTIVDAGEPGRDDQMAIRIFETANPSHVVLNVPLSFLKAGNLQAHYDQPHK